MNPHYPAIMIELSALPLLEKYAAAENDAEMVLCAQAKTAELCNVLVQQIFSRSSYLDADAALTEKEAATTRAVEFVLSLRETRSATGEKLAASPEETADLVMKLATALYLDRVLDEQRLSGVKEAAECQALGREYTVEILRSLLA